MTFIDIVQYNIIISRTIPKFIRSIAVLIIQVMIVQNHIEILYLADRLEYLLTVRNESACAC